MLIFTSTQPRAMTLAEELVCNNTVNADCLHVDRRHKERADAVSRMRRCKSWVMVTTEVRGARYQLQGGIRKVISHDFLTSVQSYIHRIGLFFFFGIFIRVLMVWTFDLHEKNV